MHRLEYDDQGRVILYVGAGNWPVPIPLVKKDNGWVFDTAAGKDELLFRRIGRNELFTIKVLEDLAKAQSEYASQAHDGSEGQFAQKILSDPGKHNGLYWEAAEGQPESPIGPLVASASAEGYKKDSSGNPVPFHGYYYKVLEGQGKNAPGGAKKYLVDGKMIEWIRVHRLSRRVSRIRCYDIHDQPGRRHRSKRPWARHRQVGW